MRNHFNFLISLALALQFLLLNYYSFYGFYKSVNEYFCTNSRPSTFTSVDEAVHVTQIKSTFAENEIVMSIYNGKFVYFDKKNGGMVSNRDFVPGILDFHFIRQHDRGDPEQLETGFSFKTYGNSNYLRVVCDAAGIKGTKAAQLSSAFGLIYNENPTEETEAFTCVIYRTPEDCTLPLEVTNKFLMGFAGISLIIISIFLSTLVKAKKHITLRLYRSLVDVLTPSGRWGTFCNPITGRPTFFKKGDAFNVLSNQSRSNGNVGVTNHFTDLNGSYTLLGNRLSIKANRATEVLVVNGDVVNEIKSYFDEILFDPKLCVLNGEHFMETAEVLKKIALGFSLEKRTWDKDVICNDVFETDIISIRKQHNLGRNIIIFLLEHNVRFFKELNIEPLYKCLLARTSFSERPGSVNNSTWKFYGSDYHIIMKKFLGLETFRQVKWQASKCLNEMLTECDKNPDFVNVVNDDVAINVVITKDLVISRELNKVVKTYGEVVSCEAEKKENAEKREELTGMKKCISEIYGEAVEINKSLLKDLKETYKNTMDYKGKLKIGLEMTNKAFEAYQNHLKSSRIRLIQPNELSVKVVKKPRKNVAEIKTIESFYKDTYEPHEMRYRAWKAYKELPLDVQEELKHTIIKKSWNKTQHNNICHFNDKELPTLVSKVRDMESHMIIIKNRFETLSKLDDDEDFTPLSHQVSTRDILDVLVNRTQKKKKKRKPKKIEAKNKVAKESESKYKSAVLKSPFSKSLKVAKILIESQVEKIKDLPSDSKPVEIKPKLVHLLKYTALKISSKILFKGGKAPDSKIIRLYKGRLDDDDVKDTDFFTVAKFCSEVKESIHKKLVGAINECMLCKDNVTK